MQEFEKLLKSTNKKIKFSDKEIEKNLNKLKLELGLAQRKPWWVKFLEPKPFMSLATGLALVLLVLVSNPVKNTDQFLQNTLGQVAMSGSQKSQAILAERLDKLEQVEANSSKLSKKLIAEVSRDLDKNNYPESVKTEFLILSQGGWTASKAAMFKKTLTSVNEATRSGEATKSGELKTLKEATSSGKKVNH